MVGTRRGSLGISVLAEPRTPSRYYTSQAPCSLNVGSWTVTVLTCVAGRSSGLMLKKSSAYGKWAGRLFVQQRKKFTAHLHTRRSVSTRNIREMCPA